MPKEPEASANSEFKNKAANLLGKKAKLYEYSYKVGEDNIFGFRSSMSYAEFSSKTARLVKALIHRTPAYKINYTEEDAKILANEFLQKNGYAAIPLKEESRDKSVYIFRYEDEFISTVIGITKDKGEVCFFLASEKSEKSFYNS